MNEQQQQQQQLQQQQQQQQQQKKATCSQELVFEVQCFPSNHRQTHPTLVHLLRQDNWLLSTQNVYFIVYSFSYTLLH